MGLPSNCFVPNGPQAREVELADGETHVVHFVALKSPEWSEVTEGFNSEDKKLRHEVRARLVAATLCEPDGAPSLTFEQAKGVYGPVLDRLVGAAVQVNGYSTKKELPPAAESGSGTS